MTCCLDRVARRAHHRGMADEQGIPPDDAEQGTAADDAEQLPDGATTGVVVRPHPAGGSVTRRLQSRTVALRAALAPIARNPVVVGAGGGCDRRRPGRGRGRAPGPRRIRFRIRPPGRA